MENWLKATATSVLLHLKAFWSFYNPTLLLLWALQRELDFVGSKQVISQRNWSHVSQQILLLIRPDCFNMVWVQSLVKVQQVSLQQSRPTSSPSAIWRVLINISEYLYHVNPKESSSSSTSSSSIMGPYRLCPQGISILSARRFLFLFKWPNEQSIVAALHTVT